MSQKIQTSTNSNTSTTTSKNETEFEYYLIKRNLRSIPKQHKQQQQQIKESQQAKIFSNHQENIENNDVEAASKRRFRYSNPLVLCNLFKLARQHKRLDIHEQRDSFEERWQEKRQTPKSHVG